MQKDPLTHPREHAVPPKKGPDKVDYELLRVDFAKRTNIDPKIL